MLCLVIRVSIFLPLQMILHFNLGLNYKLIVYINNRFFEKHAVLIMIKLLLLVTQKKTPIYLAKS